MKRQSLKDRVRDHCDKERRKEEDIGRDIQENLGIIRERLKQQKKGRRRAKDR